LDSLDSLAAQYGGTPVHGDSLDALAARYGGFSSAAPASTGVSKKPWKQSPLEYAAAYPANALMQQVGNRVDALEASAAAPFVEAVTENKHTSPLRFLANVGQAVATGTPPRGYTQGAASYELSRKAGLNKDLAYVPATLGGFAAGLPLNWIGEGTLAAVAPAVSGMMDASGIRGARIPGTRSTVGEMAGAVSRTAPIATQEGRQAAQLLREQSLMDQSRLVTHEGQVLGNRWDQAAAKGAKLRGESLSDATSRMATAVEDLARRPHQQAVGGLTPEEIQVVTDARDWLSQFPQKRAALGMKPWALGAGDNAVGYFPRAMDETGQFPTSGKVLAQYGAKQGAKMANAQFINSFASARDVGGGGGVVPAGSQAGASRILSSLRTGGMTSRDLPEHVTTSEANQILAGIPKGGPQPLPEGILAGFDDPTRAALDQARLRPSEVRFLRGFEEGKRAGPTATADALMTKGTKGWKPLVTSGVPAFAERFALTHGLKLGIDQGPLPVLRALGRAATGNKLSPAMEEQAIRSGWKSAEPADYQTSYLAPLQKVNSALYDAMKTEYGLNRIKAGDTPVEASQATRKALGDYSQSNFTPTENDLRRWKVPFYAFSRQLFPTLFRTAATRPGTLGAVEQTARNENTRLGFKDEDARLMGPGAEEGMPVVLWRGTGADSSKVVILDPNMNPMRHMNQLMGTRGRGWRGRVDAAVGMVNPLAGGAEELYSLRSALKGKTEDPNSLVKLPSVAHMIPHQWRKGAGIFEAHGQLFGSPELSAALYKFPPLFNTAVDAVRASQGSEQAQQGVAKWAGLLPIRYVDLKQSRKFERSQIKSQQYEKRKENRQKGRLSARALADSLEATTR